MCLLDQNVQKLIQGVCLLVFDFGFCQVIGIDDCDIIVLVLVNYGVCIGVFMGMLVGIDGFIYVFIFEYFDIDLQCSSLELVCKVGNGNGVVESVVVGDNLFQIVVVLIKVLVIIVWVVMGFLVDCDLVNDMCVLL